MCQENSAFFPAQLMITSEIKSQLASSWNAKLNRGRANASSQRSKKVKGKVSGDFRAGSRIAPINNLLGLHSWFWNLQPLIHVRVDNSIPFAATFKGEQSQALKYAGTDRPIPFRSIGSRVQPKMDGEYYKILNRINMSPGICASSICSTARLMR